MTILGPYNLGIEKRDRYKIWTDWIKDAKTKPEFMVHTGNSKRLG